VSVKVCRNSLLYTVYISVCSEVGTRWRETDVLYVMKVRGDKRVVVVKERPLCCRASLACCVTQACFGPRRQCLGKSDNVVARSIEGSKEVLHGGRFTDLAGRRLFKVY